MADEEEVFYDTPCHTFKSSSTPRGSSGGDKHHIAVPSGLLLCALHGVWAFPLLCFSASYTLAIMSGRVTWKDFFISSSIDVGDRDSGILPVMPDKYGFDPQGIAHRVGGMGLAFTSTATLLSVIGIYVLRSAEIASAALLDHVVAAEAASLQVTATYVGALSSVGMVGVALFNASWEIHVHLSWAFLAFFDGVIFMLIQTRIDSKLRQVGGAMIPDLRLYRLRQFLCVLSLLALVGMFGLFVVSKALPLPPARNCL